MKTEKRKMNVRLLRRIQRKILKEPKQFFMYSWFTSDMEDYNIPNCVTAACIGGWAVALSRGLKPDKAWALMHQKAMRRKGAWVGCIIEAEGANALGLDHYQGVRLFSQVSWPVPFQSEYDRARSPLQRARIAAKRIDHFIETKGEE